MTVTSATSIHHDAKASERVPTRTVPRV